jgi:hypothetical protein
MKKIFLGFLVSATVLGGAATIAEARTNFNLYLGVPYYDYQVGPEYRFNERYGWYDPGFEDPYGRPDYRPRYRSNISCGEARGIVRENGFRNVVARECNGRTYTFNATKNNRRVIIYVNSRTGAVWRG